MKDNVNNCINCNSKTNINCDVCGRAVCKECIEINHKNNNLRNEEIEKRFVIIVPRYIGEDFNKSM